MQCHLISVSQKVPDWVTQGYDTYVKRLPKELALQLKAIPTAKRQGNNTAQCLASEGKLMRKAIPQNSHVIALDERGSLWDTVTLAKKMADWQMQGQHICFLVGGPDGFDNSIHAHVNETWSLSRLTLPHAMIRVILAEQLYRAWTLLNQHPYHRS